MCMDDKSNTKKKLIKAGIKLFAQYGYTATSTRMIASEAGVNLSAISFHFTNKECLYVACLEYVLEQVMSYYADSYAEIEAAFDAGTMTAEKAYVFLEKLLDLQIEAAFGKKYKTTLALIYRENNELEYIRPLSSAVFERQEHSMAKLIMVLAPVSEKQAMLTSRHINGSIITFGEHGNLMDFEDEDLDMDYRGRVWVFEEIKNNCLAIVKRLIESQDFLLV